MASPIAPIMATPQILFGQYDAKRAPIQNARHAWVFAAHPPASPAVPAARHGKFCRLRKR
jgi:hypothetical protein